MSGFAVGGYDNTRPNHMTHDSLGDPVTCTGNHNHSPAAAEAWRKFQEEPDVFASIQERYAADVIDVGTLALDGVIQAARDTVGRTEEDPHDPGLARRFVSAVHFAYTVGVDADTVAQTVRKVLNP